MTLQEAKAKIYAELILAKSQGPITLHALCERMGVCRSGRRYSRKGYALYALYGRALQALKKENLVDYFDKDGGGPGWRASPNRARR